MTCWTKEELENMLFSVVDELQLSDSMIEKHGPMGTEPAVLVREVLDQKDLQIDCLRNGFSDVSEITRLREQLADAEKVIRVVENYGSWRYALKQYRKKYGGSDE